ncbi:MAG: peptidase T [Salibacteraceae bacterium]
MQTPIQHTVTERFLRYVQVDTQSDPDSTTFPSTEKQKDLSRILVEELLEMGITDAHLDAHGYVYATLPATTTKKVPTICFCSHVDTSPDASGTGVKPQVYRNYQGQKIVLPGDNSQVLDPADLTDLQNQMGHDIITTDGTTLLGGDDKAGVAEIMDMVHHFITHPEISHGKVRVLFTPDEEVGRGVDHVDMEKLGADFGYTVDGGRRGTLENETFSADAAVLTVEGFGIHPGYAKDKLENAVKIAARILERLPQDRLSPETTEGKAPFVHPVTISGTAEKAEIVFILRSFNSDELPGLAEVIRTAAEDELRNYHRSSFQLEVKEQYRNLKEILDQHPEVVSHAEEAIRRAGMEPELGSIRGGTDGSRLSFMGLPCPNIFAGEKAIHSKLEWISVQDMELAVKTLVELVCVWEERSE